MVARAFITGISGLALTAEERSFLRAADPWGFILFKRNVDSPDQVFHIANAMAVGLLLRGVLSVMKHIPGHGRATADSHQRLPVVDTNRDALELTDFRPFRALAGPELLMAMTAHVVFTAIDPL